jgi:cell wall-associated NlpC family hydrolase
MNPGSGTYMNISKHIFSLAVLLTIIIGVSGCAGTPAHETSSHAVVHQSSDMSQRLDAYYRRWKGTPYRFGGQSKKGVDCSGFVQLTYRDVFGTKIPRTTKLLSREGVKISSDHVRFGDLVFFKTGFSKTHVGIYIGHGKFMHASTSQGVTISQLHSDYWEDHYWQARRITRS